MQSKVRYRPRFEALEDRLNPAPLLPPQSHAFGTSLGELGPRYSQWAIESGLGGGTDLSDGLGRVRFIPTEVAVPTAEFSVTLRPGTPFFSTPFFVFGETYDDPNVPDDTPQLLIDLEIFETAQIQTVLDGRVALEGTGTELARYNFGPDYFDEPIVYAAPQPRGPGLNATSALFVQGIGTLFHPLPVGEHTLVNTVHSPFFGDLQFTYHITVSPQAASAAKAADTQALPFKITGGGPAPGGLPLTPGGTGPHYATGTATHLGKYTGEGTFELGSLAISATGAVTGTFQGSFVFVAANGDRLAFTYGDGFTGQFTGQLSADGTAVTNVTFDAIFAADPDGSTGRFAGAAGSFRMIAKAESISLVSDVPGFTAPFDYTWSGEGTLVVSKGKK